MADDIRIEENAAHHRFEIWVGEKPAGKTVYRGGGQRYEFLHTEIDPSFEGQGLGSKLIRSTLDTLRERGAKLVPYCPFIRAYIEKHPEYQDLVTD